MFWFVIGIIALIMLFAAFGLSLISGGFFATLTYFGLNELGVSSDFVMILLCGISFIIGIKITPIIFQLITE